MIISVSGLYTIVTFPFLFALMFGDIGHALIVVIFATWMVVYERSIELVAKKNEISNIFFAGRYILLLMGLFSIYTGFIYNDVFSLSINLFGSHWKITFDDETLSENPTLILDPRTDTTSSLYFAGVDPIWNVGLNLL